MWSQISEFPWGNLFPNINKYEQAQLFTQTILNKIPSYIPHEAITCDDWNPPLIDKKRKKLVLHKNCACNVYSRDRNNTDLFNKFQLLQAYLKTTIEESKWKYYSHQSDKLLDSKKSLESHWSKIPCISTLSHNNKFIVLGIFYKFRAVFDIWPERAHFNEKKALFYESSTYKALHNCCKRGQHSIVEHNIGLDYALS